MEVKFSSPAKKYLKKLPAKERVKIFKKIQILREDPFIGKKLRGEFEGLRSVKAWPFRIVYHYSLSEKLLFIEIIEHRQRAYK